MTTAARESEGRFVAESYLPNGSSRPIGELISELRQAARAHRTERIRLVRCTELPDDELCTWTFAATSEGAVRTVSAAVNLELERVSRAVERWPRRP